MPLNLMATLSGVLFGLGQAISQMINPDKVISFLNITGDWDPSLALVLAAAVSVSALGFTLSKKMDQPWFGEVFSRPTRSDLDTRLIVGAALFGIGWGLVGYCPGPAIAALTTGSLQPLLFVAAMLAGAGSVNLIDRHSR
ncbi:YeeE/YedE family protein [Halieaceae bacterium IMCC8485]|uniref:YeeE/YedE family protein n=1 Tax=Candidatus Seongchinamella marina TaxID=2518990 RepID=A0ABT3SZU0_9GAMM|nr:DUF6691 family protein [Candidatus Seongchinamella marina]MCX2975518.1 YeeE/YedE family protein [Candidatus Seongchinamella marina]